MQNYHSLLYREEEREMNAVCKVWSPLHLLANLDNSLVFRCGYYPVVPSLAWATHPSTRYHRINLEEQDRPVYLNDTED